MFVRLIKHSRLMGLVLLCLAAGAANAAQWQAFEPSSAWLKQLSMGQDGQYRARYSQARHLQIMQQPLLSSGELLLDAKQGLIWQQLKPFKQSLVVTDTVVSQYDRGGQLMRLPAAAQQMIQAWAPMMQQVILGQWTLLSERFEVLVAEGASTERWEMQLHPRDPQMQAALANIELSGGQQLQHIAIYQQNGDGLRIDLQQQVWQGLNQQQISWFNE